MLLAAAAVFWALRFARRSAPMPPPPAARTVAPPANPPVDLARHDGQTIDFSSGRPVVQDTPADRAALDRALKEMQTAAGDVTFAPPPPSTTAPKPAASTAH